MLGLRAHGHDVYFVEDSDDYTSCYDPARGSVDADPSYELRFAAHAFERLGLAARWSFYNADTGRFMGPLAPLAN